MNKPQQIVNRIYCNAILSTRCKVVLLNHQMYRDPCGFYWCEEHKYRGRLLAWAQRHGYPPINYVSIDKRYAIGNEREESQMNEELWKSAVVTGNDDMIWSAISEVMGIDDEGEEAI